LDLGERLKALRLAAGFPTQSALARASGVTQTNISEIERGSVTNPRRETLERLAAAMNVKLQDLLGQEDVAERSLAWFWRSRFATIPIQQLMDFRHSTVQQRVSWAIAQLLDAFPVDQVVDLLGADSKVLTAVASGEDTNVDALLGQLVQRASLPYNWAVAGEAPLVDEVMRQVLSHHMAGSYLRVVQKAIEYGILPELLEQQIELAARYRNSK
jgi:XRE family transcriptional regulator of biofilm formation